MRKVIMALAIVAFAASLYAVAPKSDKSSKSNNSTIDMLQDSIPAGPTVMMTTSMGDIKVRLYDGTPKHRDNFLKLVNEGYYDGVLFHRVIKDFMVQTGDPNSKGAAPNVQLGTGDPGYTIEAEIDYPKYFHKYGALAAARTADQINPERRSSGSQFYIVTGNKYSGPQLQQMQERMVGQSRQAYFQRLVNENAEQIKALRLANDSTGLETLRQELIAKTEASVQNVAMPEHVMKAYTTVGGTPHLDAGYTVFGEVIEGMEVVEKIQNSATGKADRPIEDITIISVKVVE